MSISKLFQKMNRKKLRKYLVKAGMSIILVTLKSFTEAGALPLNLTLLEAMRQEKNKTVTELISESLASKNPLRLLLLIVRKGPKCIKFVIKVYENINESYKTYFIFLHVLCFRWIMSNFKEKCYRCLAIVLYILPSPVSKHIQH